MTAIHFFENYELGSLDSDHLFDFMKISFLKNLLQDREVRKHLKSFEITDGDGTNYNITIYQFADHFLMYTTRGGKDQFEDASTDLEDILQILGDDAFNLEIISKIRKFFTE